MIQKNNSTIRDNFNPLFDTANCGASAYVIEYGKKIPADFLEEYIDNLAASLVCKENNPPCGKCSGCKKAFNHAHPDINYISGSGKTLSVSVESARFIVRDAYILPNEAKYKVYIIKDGDNINIAAQNALLKIIEEPPLYCVFIIFCSDRKLLLPTVLSRSITVNLNYNGDYENESGYEELCEKFFGLLLKGDEYGLLKVGKEMEKTDLAVLSEQLCARGTEFICSCPDETDKLLSACDAFYEAKIMLRSNANISLLINAAIIKTLNHTDLY